MINNIDDIFMNISEWAAIIKNAADNFVECPSPFERKFCMSNELTDIWFNETDVCVEYTNTKGKQEFSRYSHEYVRDWFNKIEPGMDEDDIDDTY